MIHEDRDAPRSPGIETRWLERAESEYVRAQRGIEREYMMMEDLLSMELQDSPPRARYELHSETDEEHDDRFRGSDAAAMEQDLRDPRPRASGSGLPEHLRNPRPRAGSEERVPEPDDRFRESDVRMAMELDDPSDPRPREGSEERLPEHLLDPRPREGSEERLPEHLRDPRPRAYSETQSSEERAGSAEPDDRFSARDIRMMTELDEDDDSSHVSPRSRVVPPCAFFSSEEEGEEEEGEEEEGGEEEAMEVDG